MTLITIDEKYPILQIPSIRQPLSADVFLFSEGDVTWIFDTGSLPEIADYLNEIPGEKRVILSHFHRDHSANLTSLSGIASVYATDYTVKHLHQNELAQRIKVEYITQPTAASSRVTLIPLRSSHAKGCLAMLFDQKYLFLGDAIYGMPKNGESVYNAQLLLEEIRQLSDIETEYFCPSHRGNVLCKKEAILTFLNGIYEKREKNVPTIIL